MNIYKLLKLNQIIKSHRVKFFGIWILSIFNRRFYSIQFDPVLACNYKCKMCYFTDPEALKKLKGIFKKEDLNLIAKRIFNKALMLQIGCGAEPTLFKHNIEILQLAKKHNIPYIKLITNGNLLSKEDIENFSKNGLNEIILSLHGVHKNTYENFMAKGNYEKFHQVLQWITDEQLKNKNLYLRINYTFNEDNFEELEDFFDVFGKYNINTIQLRPIDKIGNTEYNNFSLKKIENKYKPIIEKIYNSAKQKGVSLLAPANIKRENIIINKVNKKSIDNSYLLPYVNCYISPEFFWKKNYNFREQSFKEWKHENKWHWQLFNNIFISKKKLDGINRNILNYNIDLN